MPLIELEQHIFGEKIEQNIDASNALEEISPNPLTGGAEGGEDTSFESSQHNE